MRNFILLLEEITDPRTGNAEIHKLSEIVFIAVAAAVAGVTEWTLVEVFAEKRIDYLKRYLELPGGIPSHDTFGRVFRLLSAQGIEKIFRELVKMYLRLTKTEDISIDGKTIRGSGAFGKQYGVHVVSAYAGGGVVLGQLKVGSKENEITAIPKLIETLEIRGCTISIDAIGCQKNIAELITDKGAYYVLAVKDNQKRLKEGIEDTVRMEKPDAEYREVEGDHGRIETRTCRLYYDLSHIEGSWNWKGLRAVVSVESIRENKKSGEVTRDMRYYITSKAHATAEKIAHTIRGHWGIENQLHWMLNVIFGEDKSRKRAGNSAEDFSRVQRLARMLLKQYRERKGEEKKSLRRIMLEAMVDTEILDEVLIGWGKGE